MTGIRALQQYKTVLESRNSPPTRFPAFHFPYIYKAIATSWSPSLRKKLELLSCF